ncbi:hypothetical protein [Phaeocystidibacter luteus]|uniref:Uncharacterized protein n=1 Tax=Phaeocystidibacter luteus TaxID=911197 RepID=A0A6N6RHK2_9FLAO|nr:hypothetical protein [Phaeocystidibacter luteus]KAB2809799.1 hypothetical protein F8C67_09595 [Phaeocystidibacter luteus]
MGYSGNNGPEQLKAIRNLKGRHAANSFKNLRKRTELKIEELHVDRSSPAVMAAIRADIEAERKRRNRWIYGVMAACIAVLFSVFYYLDTTPMTHGVMSSIDECNQIENPTRRFECHLRKGKLNMSRYPSLSTVHFESAVQIMPQNIRAREYFIQSLVDGPISPESLSKIDGQISEYKSMHGYTRFIIDYEQRFERILQSENRWTKSES